METFTLTDLADDITEETSSDFIKLFNEGQSGFADDGSVLPPSPPAINLEEEARRIFEEAYAEGEKAGHKMGMQRVEPLVKRLGTFLAELSVFKEELIKRAENLSTELALVFAEAIILKECRDDHESILRMVKKALSLCEGRSGTTIRLRKEDADLISTNELNDFKIVKDDTLHEPGFIIETNFGDIDGRVSVQIEELKREFLNGRTD
jgi:flagellar assembly protein FliH